MGCLISCDPPEPPTGPIVATAFLHTSDMSSLSYCSDSSGKPGASSTLYLVFLTDTFFTAYSSLCGAQIEITYKNTIHAQVVDAVACSECGDEDIALNYAAFNALNGYPVEQSQPAPLSCLPSQASTTSSLAASISRSATHPHVTIQSTDSAALTDVAGSGASGPTKARPLETLSESGNNPSSATAPTSPSPLSVQHGNKFAKIAAPSVVLSLALLGGLSFMSYRRLLRRRRNQSIATPAISYPRREQSPQISPYIVHLTSDPDGEVPTTRREKTALWEKSLRGGDIEPVLDSDLIPNHTPRHPERPSLEQLDLEI